MQPRTRFLSLVVFAVTQERGAHRRRSVLIWSLCPGQRTAAQARGSRMVLYQHASQQEPANLKRDDRICRNRGAAAPAGRAVPAMSTAAATMTRPNWPIAPAFSHPRPATGVSQLPITRPPRSTMTNRAATTTANTHGSHIAQARCGQPDRPRNALHNPIVRHPAAPRHKTRTGTTTRRLLSRAANPIPPSRPSRRTSLVMSRTRQFCIDHRTPSLPRQQRLFGRSRMPRSSCDAASRLRAAAVARDPPFCTRLLVLAHTRKRRIAIRSAHLTGRRCCGVPDS